MISSIILVAFLLYKKPVFAVYLCYILCVAGWILSHYGHIFPFIYPHLPVINEIAKPVSSLGASLLLIIVLQSVFRQQLQPTRWLKQSLKWILYLLLLLTGSMLLLLIPGLDSTLKFGLILGWHAGLVISIVLIMITPLYFIKTDFTARIFLLAMLVICLMAAVQLFSNLILAGGYFINEHGMMIASLLEISIMAYGLFYSLLKDSRNKAKQVLVLQLEQTETLKKLITVQDNERKRIAADLHDNIGPLLAALKINFGRIVHTKEPALLNGVVAKTESIIDDSIAEIRNVAHNLMPKSLSSNGLINTIKEYLDCIQQLHDKTVFFTHSIQSIINPDIQMNIYRIVSELVLNAAKHSFAREITVTLSADEKSISLKISDNGRGFITQPGSYNRSLGLQNAESRVLYLKGKYTFKTELGVGTFIEIEIPLQLNEAHINGFQY